MNRIFIQSLYVHTYYIRCIYIYIYLMRKCIYSLDISGTINKIGIRINPHFPCGAIAIFLWVDYTNDIWPSLGDFNKKPPWIHHGQSLTVHKTICCWLGLFSIWGSVKTLVPLVNIKIAGKWMFIPLKMVLIGIDPYPYSKKLKD